jgi:hypothetical protein
MHKLRNACRGCGRCYAGSAIAMYSIEFLSAAFVQNANEVYHHISAGDGGLNGRVVANICRHRDNLSHVSQWLATKRLVGTTAGHPYLVSLSSQSAHDSATKKSGATKHRDYIVSHSLLLSGHHCGNSVVS